jgi:3-dehydroquinate dehydratase-2
VQGKRTFITFRGMKIIIINGPNLNLLGIREKHIYGDKNFGAYMCELEEMYPKLKLEYFQSNHEGALIDKIHEIGFSYDGIILNAGAYGHTSIALADAIAAIKTPVVEIHISNVYNRDRFRHHSFISKHCKGIITGLGIKGYELAIQSFL